MVVAIVAPPSVLILSLEEEEAEEKVFDRVLISVPLLLFFILLCLRLCGIFQNGNASVTNDNVCGTLSVAYTRSLNFINNNVNIELCCCGSLLSS